MSSDYNYRLLQKDIKEGKQIVLFLGAGINYCKEYPILWADVMGHLFKSVVLNIASENNLSNDERTLFIDLFGIKLNSVTKTNKTSRPSGEMLQYVYNEFPFTLQSYIVKKHLDKRYIPIIQNFIYLNIDGEYIKEHFN